MVTLKPLLRTHFFISFSKEMAIAIDWIMCELLLFLSRFIYRPTSQPYTVPEFVRSHQTIERDPTFYRLVNQKKSETEAVALRSASMWEQHKSSHRFNRLNTFSLWYINGAIISISLSYSRFLRRKQCNQHDIDKRILLSKHIFVVVFGSDLERALRPKLMESCNWKIKKRKINNEINAYT